MEKKSLQRAAAARDRAEEAAHVEAARSHPMLTESELLVVNTTTGRPRKDHFKGLSAEEIADVRSQQAAQRAEMEVSGVLQTSQGSARRCGHVNVLLRHLRAACIQAARAAAKQAVIDEGENLRAMLDVYDAVARSHKEADAAAVRTLEMDLRAQQLSTKQLRAKSDF